MTDQSGTGSSHDCYKCGTELSGDDLVHRVLYGRYHHAQEGNVSEKLAGRADEELDPGARERYWCFDCYQEHRSREKGAHYHYEDADELWAILEAADGRLVADAKVMTVGGRGWFRVVDGAVQARHSVSYKDDDGNVRFDTEPTEDFDTADFGSFFDGAGEIKMVYLKPVDETPFVAGQNRTLGASSNA